MILVGFPTKFEAEDFIQRLSNATIEKVEGIECYAGRIGDENVLVAILGIGPIHSAQRVEKILSKVSTKMVLLAGFAGGLVPELVKGQILVAKGYTSEETLNYIKILPGFDIASLCTMPTVISTAAQKAELASQTGCQFVDMEAGSVAQAVVAAGVEMMVVRVISDTVHEDLPADLLAAAYDYETAKETPVKMAIKLILNPWKIGQLKAFLAPLPEVRRKLTDFLVALIPELS